MWLRNRWEREIIMIGKFKKIKRMNNCTKDIRMIHDNCLNNNNQLLINIFPHPTLSPLSNNTNQAIPPTSTHPSKTKPTHTKNINKTFQNPTPNNTYHTKSLKSRTNSHNN